MTRDDAVVRIQDGLGFRYTVADKIILRLQEAQRHLERGKTLPKFLIEQDAELTLLEGMRETAKPSGFLQEVDEGYLWTADLDPPELIRVPDINTGLSFFNETTLDTAAGPRIYVILSQSIWFFTRADQTYVMSWDYYKKADPLTSNIENAWLADDVGAYLLIGDAGLRMAMDMRNAEAKELFTGMRNDAWKALYSDIVYQDDIPLFMGSAL